MNDVRSGLDSIAKDEPAQPPTTHTKVVAILRLSDSRRTWFITAIQRSSAGLLLSGYEPGRMHSRGEKWFNLGIDFFELAAMATKERLVVEILREPTPLAMIEDAAL